MSKEFIITCPICGEAMYTEVYSNRKTEFDGHCTNNKCPLYEQEFLMMNAKDWQTRPVEEELRAKLSSCTALIERLVEAGGEALEAVKADAYFSWQKLVAEYRASKKEGTTSE